jgi:pimeloyl-ACP methyl ester carboxylesterase
MNATAAAPTSAIIVNGARIELIDRGHRRPILFLHPHIGLDPSAPVLAMLAEGGRLIAPSHPGFGHSAVRGGAGGGVTTIQWRAQDSGDKIHYVRLMPERILVKANEPL